MFKKILFLFSLTTGSVLSSQCPQHCFLNEKESYEELKASFKSLPNIIAATTGQGMISFLEKTEESFSSLFPTESLKLYDIFDNTTISEEQSVELDDHKKAIVERIIKLSINFINENKDNDEKLREFYSFIKKIDEALDNKNTIVSLIPGITEFIEWKKLEVYFAAVFFFTLSCKVFGLGIAIDLDLTEEEFIQRCKTSPLIFMKDKK